MSTPNTRPGVLANQRRSQRILLSIPILVSGKRANNATFTERTKTAVVNAHRGLILLCEPVVTGQMLKIHNIVTNEELVCIVIDINPGQNGLPEVGVEFAQPNPRFWHVSFPPVDWNPRNPEAKRFDTSNHTSPAKPPLAKK